MHFSNSKPVCFFLYTQEADNSMSRTEDFIRERERLNEIILENASISMKRFFSLDTAVYKDGALSAKTKEMLGLAASTVLRCDDCINYHILQCVEHGVTAEEFNEIFDIALVVGGSITIPHIRRAYGILAENGLVKSEKRGN